MILKRDKEKTITKHRAMKKIHIRIFKIEGMISGN